LLIAGGELSTKRRAASSNHVEFENSGNCNDGLRSIAALGSHVAKRGIATNKEAAANPVLILNDPISAQVTADHEAWKSRTCARHAFIWLPHRILLRRLRAANMLAIAYEFETEQRPLS
jgi:hypothetical protein